METEIEEILSLVKKKMREQGAYDREAYRHFIDETIDYFLEKGKLTDDDNLEFIEDSLVDIWPMVKDELSEKDI